MLNAGAAPSWQRPNRAPQARCGHHGVCRRRGRQWRSGRRRCARSAAAGARAADVATRW